MSDKRPERSLMISGAAVRAAHIPEQDLICITWENYNRDYFARVNEANEARAERDAYARALSDLCDTVNRAVEKATGILNTGLFIKNWKSEG